MITAPLGYNVHVCSCHPFVFGDENAIMQDLTSVSLKEIIFDILGRKNHLKKKRRKLIYFAVIIINFYYIEDLQLNLF